MKDLIREIENCSMCEGRINGCVPLAGEGCTEARILFVGEQIPEYAHYSRSMFSGPSARILRELINISSIDRDDIYVTSLLKCNLSMREDKMHFSILNCLPFIFRQIEVIDPLFICPLGGKVLRVLTKDRLDFNSCRGKLKKIEGRSYFTLINPAEVFYNYNMRCTLEKDFINLGEIYNDFLKNNL